MESTKNPTISYKNIVIFVLSICLVCVLGLFLYSEYQLSASSEDVSNSVAKPSVSNQNSVSPQKETTQEKKVSKTTEATQPDKSLPIPAHQLKKLVAEPTQQDELDKKIASANKTIAELEKTIKSPVQQSSEQSPSSQINSDNKSQALNQRIENIRHHLEKN